MSFPNKQEGYKGPSFVQLDTIKAMVTEFVSKTYKLRENGAVEKLTYDNDAHAVWFSKEAIDQLFADNGYKPGATDFGLRIYLGMHGNSEAEKRDMPNRLPHYEGQHTAILVVTQNGEDLLNDVSTDAKVATFAAAATSASGRGLDEGQLCPPPVCGGTKVIVP